MTAEDSRPNRLRLYTREDALVSLEKILENEKFIFRKKLPEAIFALEGIQVVTSLEGQKSCFSK